MDRSHNSELCLQVGKWFSTLRTALSQRATERVLQWITNLAEQKKEKINIVILDFVDERSSLEIISLNGFHLESTLSRWLYIVNVNIKCLTSSSAWIFRYHLIIVMFWYSGEIRQMMRDHCCQFGFGHQYFNVYLRSCHFFSLQVVFVYLRKHSSPFQI